MTSVRPSRSPSTCTHPAGGCSRPAARLTSVVLPAPLGPSTTHRSSSSTRQVMSCSEGGAARVTVAWSIAITIAVDHSGSALPGSAGWGSLAWGSLAATTGSSRSTGLSGEPGRHGGVRRVARPIQSRAADAGLRARGVDCRVSATFSGSEGAADVRGHSRSRVCGRPSAACHKGRLALNGFDMVVEAGQVHGFLGPNGSGKTTTLRTLLGWSAPDGGRMAVLGRRRPRRCPRCRPGRRDRGEPAVLRQLHRPRARCAAGRTPAVCRSTGWTRCWSWSACATGPTTGSRRYSLGMKQRLAVARRCSRTRSC